MSKINKDFFFLISHRTIVGETKNVMYRILTDMNKPLGTGYLTNRTLYSGRGWPTSIILLLLMVVAQFSLTLSRHSSLCLHHLFGFICASRWLVSLVGIEVLNIGSRERPSITEIANRMVSWRTGSHSRI